MLSARSAPPAVTVKAAAAEQQNKHNDDQQQIHSILQQVNRSNRCLQVGSAER
jgi:hypothetical protein